MDCFMINVRDKNEAHPETKGVRSLEAPPPMSPITYTCHQSAFKRVLQRDP